MGRLLSFVLGAAVGAAAAAVTTYLFEPARDTQFDQRYQSRLDRALADGQAAAIEHDAALRLQLATTRHLSPSNANSTIKPKPVG